MIWFVQRAVDPVQGGALEHRGRCVTDGSIAAQAETLGEYASEPVFPIEARSYRRRIAGNESAYVARYVSSRRPEVSRRQLVSLTRRTCRRAKLPEDISDQTPANWLQISRQPPAADISSPALAALKCPQWSA
jgi:hypothetical protein